MTKMRVYEVARDLGMENKALVALLQSVGVTEAKNHMSAIAPEAVERVKRYLEKQKTPSVVEERIRPTVVKRRAIGKPEASSPTASAPPSAPISMAPPSEERARPARSHARRSRRRPYRPRRRSHAPSPQRSRSSSPWSRSPRRRPARKLPSRSTPRRSPEAAPPPRSSPAAAPSPLPPPTPIMTEVVPAPALPFTPPPTEAPPERAFASDRADLACSAHVARSGDAPAAAKTGIDVWEGRPGVPMPQVQRGTPTPRRVQYDPKAGAMRGRPGQQPPSGVAGRMHGGRGPMRPGMRGAMQIPKGPRPGAPPATQERSAHKKIVRIEESIGLQRLAGEMGVKATEVLMKLMRLGTTGVNINSTLDADTAKIVASDFGWEVEDVAVSEADQLVAAQGMEGEAQTEERSPRPAVVTVMGHVDHGKTSLLDQIRKTTVAAGEAGGITQHIGAYSVDTSHGSITFLDTPGHEAFTAMRARGAQATDIVILVVAADDGVMPQTREAINHAKAAKVPIVVAVNKIDKQGADPERVKRQLSEAGLVPEEWGGDTLYCNVSAHTREGVDNLLEQVALQSEVLELRANPNKPATGLVIEAELDRGRGPVASILVTDGTLNRGDVILVGGAYGKVRAMHDSHGNQVAQAGPSMPVSVIGLSDVPSAGDPVHVIKDAKTAQEIAETRKTKEKRSLVPSTGARAMTLEDLAKALAENEQLELKLIIKADVQGSVEAVADALSGSRPRRSRSASSTRGRAPSPKVT
jgi:translation initiation factor IF-2